MTLENIEKRSPCLICKFAREVNDENMEKMPNKLREVRNILHQYSHKDEEFTLCPLDGGEAIVSKYVERICEWREVDLNREEFDEI